MNHMTYSYMPNMPNQYPPIPSNQGIEEEIKKLKIEVKKLKERINDLEKKDNKNYLQKEDGFYMM